jgi:NAD(P)-dependent dehydrogenase (short-subunit alcohol dehydrogenase family)
MGSACARALAGSSDCLVLTDLDATRLAATAAPLAADGAAVVTVVGDLAEPEVIDELVRAGAGHGRFALVHTAGLSPSMAGWQEVLRVDLVGVVRLLRAFTPLVTPGSVAVCLASVSAHMGDFPAEVDAVLDDPLAVDFVERFRAAAGGEPDPGSTYRLAKWGVIRACRRTAVAWGGSGGRVVSLSPGLIDTGMGRLELAENPIKAHLVELTPLRSSRQDTDPVLPGHPDDIADGVAFLCSERAAFVTGCDLQVDGGLAAALDQPASASTGEA